MAPPPRRQLPGGTETPMPAPEIDSKCAVGKHPIEPGAPFLPVLVFTKAGGVRNVGACLACLIEAGCTRMMDYIEDAELTVSDSPGAAEEDPADLGDALGAFLEGLRGGGNRGKRR